MIEHSKDNFGIGHGINLFDWLCTLWIARKLFLKLEIVAIVIGSIVAFSIPKEYTTQIKFASESLNSSSRIRNWEGFISKTSFDLGSVSGEDALSPKLYPYMIKSSPFLLELFSAKVTYKQEEPSITLFEYMRDHQQSSWWSLVLEIPSRILSGLKVSFSEKCKEKNKLAPFYQAKMQELVLDNLRSRIDVAVNNTTGIISISVKMQDPLISAEVAQIVVEKLQKYITVYRTYKSKNDLVFTKRIFTKARETYFKAQKTYAAFEDANRNLISASNRAKQELLKNEMILTFNVYHTLAQRLEQDKLHVQEQIPIYALIEPATVPLQASSPQKMFVLLGFLSLAFFGGITYLIIKNWIGII